MQQAQKFLAIRTQMDLGKVELPPVPHVRTDLLHVRKRVTPTGVTVDYPMTSDGRHCDFGPALMLVLTKALPEPVEVKPPVATDAETQRVRDWVNQRFGPKRQEW
jgi:hypothetical protein